MCTLFKEVGPLCQLKLTSTSSQILLGNWRNDTLPSSLAAEDYYKSSGKTTINAHEMEEA